jgi:REP element-mobilizing transposase RayT
MASQFDPLKHRRRSIRLKDWDYRTPGAYFVTICAFQRQNLFEFRPYCQLAEDGWRNIPQHDKARHVRLDEWVVMPNHLHGILLLEEMEGLARPTAPKQRGPVSGSVAAVVGSYKSGVTRRINNLRNMKGSRVWQRGYYERIVRNERELNAIRRFVGQKTATI